MKITTGYYQGGGQRWDHGEVPKCDVCGGSAEGGGLRATNTSGVNICFENECAIEHCRSQFTDEIELENDGKAPCIECKTPTLPVEEGNKIWNGDLVGEFICNYCRKEYKEVDKLLDLYYFCPNCNTTWNDEWSSYVDGECEECGATYTPYDSLEKRDAAVAVSKEDVPEKREELLWEEKFDFITEDGNEVDAHQKLCNVESDDGSIVDIEIVHHTSNRGTDYEYWELFVDGHITPKSHWLYGDVEEAVYEVIEKRGLVVKLPV